MALEPVSERPRWLAAPSFALCSTLEVRLGWVKSYFCGNLCGIVEKSNVLSAEGAKGRRKGREGEQKNRFKSLRDDKQKKREQQTRMANEKAVLWEGFFMR
jgi:hypothetical protein